jgi:regulator of extracellular matrix RemA (YlzA/DUF370 family)
MKIISIGNGHTIVAEKIVSVINYGSRPTVRLKEEYEKKTKAINLTGGDKVRTLILAEGDYLFLIAVKSDTINQRLEKKTE